MIAGTAIRTPLVRLRAPEAEAEIYLKLENLQPIGSFKLRGAANAIRQADRAERAAGVLTASAGNMAQGVAWAAGELGIPCTVVVPEAAPETKLAAIERLGGRVIKVPFARWWQTMEESHYPGVEGLFVHPVQDDLVMAGNGMVGLELLEDLPDVDAVVVPWGGGGLTTGIASALKGSGSRAKVYAVEVTSAAPLAAAFAAGSPQVIPYEASFVDGIGSTTTLPKMWPLAQELVDGVFAASPGEAAAAVRLLAERSRVIAEGAAACAVAVALSGRAGTGKVACIVSGGNIDSGKLARILSGETP